MPQPTDKSNKDVQEQDEKEYRFYLKKKPIKEDKKKDDNDLFICCRGVCIPLNMSLSDALDFCAKLNKLSSSQDPKDRHRRDDIWNLLLQGQEAKAVSMSCLEAKEDLLADKTSKRLSPAPDTLQKRPVEDALKKSPETAGDGESLKKPLSSELEASMPSRKHP